MAECSISVLPAGETRRPPLDELCVLDAPARAAIRCQIGPLGELRDRTRTLRHLLWMALERLDALEAEATTAAAAAQQEDGRR